MIKIGKQSEEVSFKLYQGIGAFMVLAVNPNKQELKDITGRDMEEPVYTGVDDNGNKFTRVTFWIKTSPNAPVNNGIEMTTSLNFIITNAYVVSKNTGKTKVIDKYGRTAWVTKEELAAHTVPQYSNGPANICTDYREIYQGEENLINFLISWLNIPSPMEYIESKKKWVLKENASDSEIVLDFKALFTGNVSEISQLVNTVTTKKTVDNTVTFNSVYLVKASVGVRTTDDGKQYQNIYNRMFVKNGVTNYNKLNSDIESFKANGGAPNVEYDTTPLHEYKIEATNFAETKEDPFNTNDNMMKMPWD